MDEQRAEFEAWAKSKGAPKDGWWIRQIDDGGYSCHAVDMAWGAWQATTQRQQERITELEAQVQALSLDAGRLDWLTFHLSGKALRDFYAAAYRAGMERAAEICESIAREDYGMTDLHEYGECAEAIRALKEQNAAIAAGKGEG